MDNSNTLLTIVSPVYEAENLVDELLGRIHRSVSRITQNYEVILVEDGSKDNSWDKIEEHCKSDNRIKGIKLSRNFGQHNAITAGLDHCKGDWIVVMDCDLQDRPEEIPKLYYEALKGFDIVFARRRQRHDSFFKKLTSKLFNKFFVWLSGMPNAQNVANFGIYSANSIKAVNKLREPLRSFATMIKWVGFQTATIDVQHSERYAGKSSYTLRKLLHLAIDVSLSYSDKPLRMTVKVGAFIAFGAFCFGIYTLYKYYNGRITEPGFASLILSLWFLSGLIIFILGVIGLYLGKVFEGIKHRPLYIIEKIV